MDIFKSFFLIFFISFTTVSYYTVIGSIFKLSTFSNNQYKEPDSIYFQTLKGIILISFAALIIHFFFPLNNFVNSLFLIIFLIIAFLKKKIFLIKKNFDKLFFISLVSTLFIVFSNINRPDAALYHLPYVSYLNEHKIIFGLNFIHFRFATTSIIQYLSAFNYNLLLLGKNIFFYKKKKL